LPSPPPIRFSRPDHKLASGISVELASYPEDSIREEGGIVIDQCGAWRWKDRESRTIEFVPTGEIYQLSGEKTLTKVINMDDTV